MPVAMRAGRLRLLTAGTRPPARRYDPARQSAASQETQVGKGILLWLLGIPIPIILVLLLLWH
jgi:hypothetical protein